ncbi:MAG: hydroxymethylbilane synthase [Bryobacterales bacterium]|nr:hydroxymethylbilane synthase [Bryobacterales bacterium]
MIIIGSRGSKLALWQAQHIYDCLKPLGVEARIEIIKTTGDKIQDVPLAQAGGKGLFTKEIDEALLNGSIDLAVHSMKDVPTGLPAGLTIAAIPEREEPRDALIGCTVAELRDGLRIGTSSLRRSSQLLALNPRLSVQMLRGNVDTRLRKLDEGQYDAIVLAAAGLRRLGWQDRIRELIPAEVMCPAVGQGALAIETRDDGGVAHELARKLDHAETRTAVTAERAMLEVLGGGCQLPVGGYAYLEKGVIHMRAIVASPDGSRIVRKELSGVDPSRTGASMGRILLEQGAEEILRAVV